MSKNKCLFENKKEKKSHKLTNKAVHVQRDQTVNCNVALGIPPTHNRACLFV